MDIAAVGRQFGLDDQQTRAALDALVPVVAAGMRRTAQSPEGVQEIFRQVLTGSYGGTLDDDQAVSFGRAKPAGDEVLGQIFGNKQVSREVAQQLSANSGIGADILKKLLPIVATMVLGSLAKKMGGVIAGEQIPQSGSGGGGWGDILRDVLAGGQAAPPQVPHRQPMPAPGQGGSLEDILGDILSGGSVDVPQRRPSEDVVTRGRTTLDDMLGGGTSSGDAADDLLNSVERTIRGR
jgi:hypothetical protein